MVLLHGVMFAALIWSLIIPAIDMKSYLGKLCWFPACVGISLGVLFLILTDSFMKKYIDKNSFLNESKRSKMLNFAITLHNIPEGMAVGLGFASSFTGNYGVSLMSALALSIGIAIQNFPEGMAISLPYKSDGNSNFNSFMKGVVSRNC